MAHDGLFLGLETPGQPQDEDKPGPLPGRAPGRAGAGPSRGSGTRTKAGGEAGRQRDPAEREDRGRGAEAAAKTRFEPLRGNSGAAVKNATSDDVSRRQNAGARIKLDGQALIRQTRTLCKTLKRARRTLKPETGALSVTQDITTTWAVGAVRGAQA